MKIHTLTAEVWLPRPQEEVFSFFADAVNLETVTPWWLHFKILTPTPVKMGRGTLIDYQLRFYGIPMKWQSEITIWDPPTRFADVQIKGPYRHWKHVHSFASKDGGTLCRDWVEYAVPGGALVNWLLVAEEVKKIFRYRQQTLLQIFQS